MTSNAQNRHAITGNQKILLGAQRLARFTNLLVVCLMHT